MLFDRTFHPDEANQAFTVGRLLETGAYTYHPEDHHGPTLYYAAASLQRAFGHGSTATLDGTLLRCTPLLFAILALVLGFLAVYRICRNHLAPAIGSVLLLATAPMFVFFATDFIQEMLLVAFVMGMFWAGAGYALPGKRFKRGTWALLFGIFAGLAFATKETCCLSFAAFALATACVWGKVWWRKGHPVDAHPLVLGALGFILTAVLLYSGLGRDFTGVKDAFLAAPLHYLGRATGNAALSEGANWHIHPWHYYLTLLAANKTPFSNLPAFLQFASLILPLALFVRFGRYRAEVPAPLLHAFAFLAFYTGFILAFYSCIPYKTPWCALQILVPFLLTLALGYALCVCLFHCSLRERSSRYPYVMALLISGTLLAVIVVTHARGLAKLNAAPDSPAIPYNYAAAHPEVQTLASCVAQNLNPNAFTAVILPACDTWPFPWYNRALENRTGYWTDIAVLERLAAEGSKPGVLIVPMVYGHLVQPLFPHLTHTKRFFIRPGVRVRVFW